jgi:hypothetical protein
MSKFYQIKNLSPFLDVLFVEGDEQTLLFEGVSVTRLIDRSITLGDRDISYPLPSNSLFVSTKYLHAVEDPRKREYASGNPWGNIVDGYESDVGSIKVVATLFEKCLQVSVTEKETKKCLWSDYFYKDLSENFDYIKSHPPDEDLVFDLV